MKHKGPMHKMPNGKIMAGKKHPMSDKDMKKQMGKKSK